ncbi:hypothetical protein LC608_23545 [Nostoc sp. XA010]|nr:hypothetical protein [Nostoc sp. XA010]MCC5659896.1 hypothetical protein [Nostoc sp. XA010]
MPSLQAATNTAPSDLMPFQVRNASFKQVHDRSWHILSTPPDHALNLCV